MSHYSKQSICLVVFGLVIGRSRVASDRRLDPFMLVGIGRISKEGVRADDEGKVSGLVDHCWGIQSLVTSYTPQFTLLVCM